MSDNLKRYVRSGRAGAALLAGLALLLGPAAPAPGALPHRPGDTLAIVGVTLIDPSKGPARPGQTVIVAGRKIIAAGPSASVPTPRKARVVNGQGKYLVPGLWDMHVHLNMAGSSALTLMVASGVTGVRDMGGGSPVARVWQDSIRTGVLLGPRIVRAGPIVENARWLNAVTRMSTQLKSSELDSELATRLPVATPEDAVKVVDSLARLGVDFIKLRNSPPPPAYFALVREARHRGLRIAGHSPNIPLGDVADSGFASIEHTILISRDQTLGTLQGLPAPERADIIARMAKGGTAYDPTLVSTKARLIPDTLVQRLIHDSTGRIAPDNRYVHPLLRSQWQTQLDMRKLDTPLPWDRFYRENLADVQEMSRAGVLILTGTDLGVVTLVPGMSLHGELELLVRDAGLTPLEALRAGTWAPAKVMGLTDSLGSIEPGKIADLLLLDGDPLADIANTRRIAAVFANGRLLDRKALDRLLASIERPSR